MLVIYKNNYGRYFCSVKWTKTNSRLLHARLQSKTRVSSRVSVHCLLQTHYERHLFPLLFDSGEGRCGGIVCILGSRRLLLLLHSIHSATLWNKCLSVSHLLECKWWDCCSLVIVAETNPAIGQLVHVADIQLYHLLRWLLPWSPRYGYRVSDRYMLFLLVATTVADTAITEVWLKKVVSQ